MPTRHLSPSPLGSWGQWEGLAGWLGSGSHTWGKWGRPGQCYSCQCPCPTTRPPTTRPALPGLPVVGQAWGSWEGNACFKYMFGLQEVWHGIVTVTWGSFWVVGFGLSGSGWLVTGHCLAGMGQVMLQNTVGRLACHHAHQSNPVQVLG